MSAEREKPRRRLLVDGLNVIGSRPDGWWRDRRGAMRKLVATLDRYAHATGDEVTVVFDGKPFDVGEASIGVEFAPGGRGAADDAIVAAVRGDPDPAGIAVVTSDAELVERVSVVGAEAIAAGGFRRRLEEAAGE